MSRVPVSPPVPLVFALTRRQWQVVASAAYFGYIASIVLANVLTARFGLVPAGFGLLVTAGTYTAGLALTLRDAVQHFAGRQAAVLAILIAGACSVVTASPQLAAASAVAFLLSEVLDFAVYTMHEHRWRVAVVLSNIVGAVVDTLLFLTLAGFPVTWASVGGQLLVKIVWVTGAALALGEVFRRAVSRDAIDAARA